MLNAVPLTRDLVLIGGGHTHALILKKWGMNPLAGVRLSVINPGPTAAYSGMLPGHIAGHYSRDELEIDLLRLCRHAGARLILSRAVGIDRANGQVRVEGRGPIGYDVASIDIGVHARMPAIDGFCDHAVAVKPLGLYAGRWRDFLAEVRAGRRRPEVAVIGGGVAGAELALAMAHALEQAGKTPNVSIIEQGPELSGVGPAARRRLLAAMQGRVTLICNATVARITRDAVVLGDQLEVPAALTLGAAGAVPHGWLAETGLPLQEGFIRVAPDLRVEGEERLFAAGDCAHMAHAPRPKAGVFAVRAAPILHDNLRALLQGRKTRPFRPQNHYLKLISLGGKVALAEKWGIAPASALLWRWKDRIDRRFMNKLNDLREMPLAEPPHEMAEGVAGMLDGAPLCGGCGAKVGGDVLGDALAGLGRPEAGDVLSGPGDDAAILRAGEGFQVISTDHLRAFSQDASLMARIAALHALGDIWSMGARPQAALASVILPHMHPRLQARSMAEVTEAAAEVFEQAGAALVGGHSTMGAEMTIGFTVTGTMPEHPITQAGARPGDVLLLTRPIGSGVLLAAEMAGRARGRDVVQMFETMCKPQGEQAALLHRAHAMTDVTGFGLAGHLQAICTASGAGAELWREAIPLYPGAQALSEAGVASALLEANQRAAPVAGGAFPLLHDPQTAGGLLAALAPAEAAEAASALRTAGLEVWEIGRIIAGDVGIGLV